MLIKSQRLAQGFTLIEVLIAMIIVTFGMLGVASLHLVSLENTHSAHLRSQAVIISDDLIERLRSNPELLAYATTNIIDNKNSYTETSTCYSAAGCVPTLLVESELAKWVATLPRLGDTTSTGESAPPVHVLLTHQADQLFKLKITWQNKQWKSNTSKREHSDSNYEFLVALN